MIGSDVVPTLPQWHEPLRIIAQATLLIVARPHWPVMPVEELRRNLGVSPSSPLRQQVVEVPLIDLSSTDLRRRIAEGRSVRYLVPRR